MKDYIPELSERRMVDRAPDRPVAFGPDAAYILSSVAAVERAFGLTAFPGCPPDRVPARALIRQLILWWRTLDPETEAQTDAHARLPGAIRLIDTMSNFLADRAAARKGRVPG
jgi:hypothetical protein